MLSLWLPRFAVERRRPSPETSAPERGAPETDVFALFCRDGSREILFAVNSAAEKAGLSPGMTLSQARALCPGLRSEPQAPEADLATLNRLADWCERFTPWTAIESNTALGGGAGLWLDVTGCGHLFGGEPALLNRLLSGFRGLGHQVRAGLAATPGAAWALARYGCDGRRLFRILQAGEEREALAPLPVAALRLTAEQQELLQRFGLRRIADILNLPPASLATRLGPEILLRLRQALGEVGESLSPRRPRPRHEARLVFPEPLAAPEDLARAVEKLTSRLCAGLEREEEGVRRLRLTLFRAEGTRQELEFATSRATRDPAHLLRLFAQQRERLEPRFGVDALALAAEVVERLTALQITLGTAGRAPAGDELAALVDRLRVRLGGDAVGRQLPRESHLPERAARPSPPLPAPGDAAWPRTPPRPLRLLARPEPVEAMALLPDYPPVHFRWRRRLHRVRRAEGPERLSGEWWRGDPEEARDYFRVEDEDGHRFWLYRQAGRWFLQGLFG